MPRYVVITKRAGYTPLQEIEALRKTRPEFTHTSLTYAGRLDPMARGALLVLVGDECKKRQVYDKLDKEYEFEVLLGFKTDTGDILGLVESSTDSKEYSEDVVRHIARRLVGTHTIPYPAFSSKTVHGKALFEYALAGNLDTIEIPKTDMRVYGMRYMGKKVITRNNLIEGVLDKIQLLQIEDNTGRAGSDFRKDDIIAQWRTLLGIEQQHCVILKFKATVSAGTYIRSLAPLIAEKLGTKGLAYSIYRTKIGRYQPITNHVGFWRHIFV